MGLTDGEVEGPLEEDGDEDEAAAVGLGADECDVIHYARQPVALQGHLCEGGGTPESTAAKGGGTGSTRAERRILR